MNTTEPATDIFDDYGKDESIPLRFPGFEKDTRKILFVITFLLVYFQILIDGKIRRISYFIELVLNVIHLLVLTRKPMRNNAINIILAGMAINDIFIVGCAYWGITKGIGRFDISQFEDGVKDVPVINYITFNINQFLKRNDVWLPILMATTRAMVIKNFDNQKYSVMTTAKFGLFVTFSEFSFSFFISAIFFMIITSEKSIQLFGFYRLSSSYIAMNDTIAAINHYIIPSLCYPVLTIILVRELKKAKLKRASVRQETRKDSTTKMIIAMTVCFMIAEIPQGICGIMSFFYWNEAIFYISAAIMDIFAIFSIFNASTHFFICLKMSSNYRDEFCNMFRIRRKNKVSNAYKMTEFDATNVPPA